MFAVSAAVFFAIALFIDLTGTGHSTISPQTFTLIGLVLLALSVPFPGWPRRP